MTKRTARFASLPLTLALAVLMTSMTGCGGCSGDPEPGAEESSAEASGASAEGAAKSPGEAGKDEPAAPGADVTEAAEVKPKAGDRVVKRRGEAPGAMDAKAKRLADRKSREADLKKRANRRRTEDKGDAERGEAADARKAQPQSPTKPTSPLARAVPDVRLGTEDKKGGAEAASRTSAKLLNVSRFLTITEARRITGDATLSKGKPLTGIEPSQSYNVSYFAPQLRSKFGVSVQVWKEKIRRDANDRYRKMKRDFPNAEETSAVAPTALFSHFQGIMTLSFADLTKSTVVSVSCGDSVCSDQELVELANAVKKRL